MYWQYLNPTPTEDKDAPAIVRLLLENRGINQNEEKFFLDFSPPPEPKELLEEEKLLQACDLIKRAQKEKRPIIVHGDYDVDGICATAILWETLYFQQKFSLTRPFIPHRLRHGYGISEASLEDLLLLAQELSSLPPLVITVDCGIRSVKEIEKLREKGVSVILTDHHQPGAVLPPANVILHQTAVSGSGVAWLLAQSLLSWRDQENFLDLLALATIADLLPLQGINRYWVKKGLQHLQRPHRLGLQYLYQENKLEGKTITPYHVAWIIAPRLNALGRLEHALTSLKFLVTRNHQKARELALILERTNRQRQNLMQEALLEAEKQFQSAPAPVAVLSHPHWHEGVIGLIAGKISEKFNCPSFVISEGEPYCKGSARGVPNLNLIQLLEQTSSLLINFGGHKQAAGFTISRDKITLFREKLIELLQQQNWQTTTKRILTVDLILNLNQITPQLLKELQRLEPHGIGNPRPVFVSLDLVAFGAHVVGRQGQHLKFLLRSSQNPQRLYSAIAFNQGHLAAQIKAGTKLDLAYNLEQDYFQGKDQIILKVKDFHFSDLEPEAKP